MENDGKSWYCCCPLRPAQSARPIRIQWKIFAHPVFLEQFDALVHEVEQLRDASPEGFRERKKTKLLAAVLRMGFDVIPQNPAHPMFFQGNTLGAAYRHWHRGKFFEGRYRLFFRFSSEAKVIVLAWVNDEKTLQTCGSKADAYAVFQCITLIITHLLPKAEKESELSNFVVQMFSGWRSCPE